MLADPQGFKGSAESIPKQKVPRLAHKRLDSQRKSVQPGNSQLQTFHHQLPILLLLGSFSTTKKNQHFL